MVENRKTRREPKEHAVTTLLKILEEAVPAIARGISRDCEVVLHDNRTKPQRILAIGNGHVTGREPGDLMTKITINDDELAQLEQPLFNYPSVAPNGRQLRVTLIPVRHREQTVAYIAINFMIDNFVAAQKTLMQLTGMESHAESIRETFLPNGISLTQSFDECFAGIPKPPSQLARPERIEIIRRLNSRGIFHVRGAAKELALRLGMSRAAIYGYLQIVEREAKAGTEGMAA